MRDDGALLHVPAAAAAARAAALPRAEIERRFGAVAALEVFPPTTLERYRDEIWWEPPAFVR